MPPADGVTAYPELLQARLRDKWQVFTIIGGGKTIDELEPDILAALDNLRPHVLALQVGVNECGPRPLSRQERARLGRVRPRLLQSFIIRVLHAFRPHIIRARGPNQFTSATAFAECVRRIIARARALHAFVVIVPITHVSASAEIRQPFFNREIDRYNDILRGIKADGVLYLEERELFGDRRPEEFCLTPETVHLNGWAHERLAAVIADRLVGQLSSSHSEVETAR